MILCVFVCVSVCVYIYIYIHIYGVIEKETIYNTLNMCFGLLKIRRTRNITRLLHMC